MALKGCAVGSNRPKALADLSNEEAADWLRERVRSTREHECACDLPLMIEAALVARRIGASEAAYLERLIAKLQPEGK